MPGEKLSESFLIQTLVFTVFVFLLARFGIVSHLENKDELSKEMTQI